MDHAAATPVDKEVREKMEAVLDDHWANPSALYEEGRRARRFLERLRGSVAGVLGIKSNEVVFTAGATESINLAISGRVTAGGEYRELHIITTSLEHPAVTETVRSWEEKGVKVTYLAPDDSGVIKPEQVKEALRPETVLVSVMYVNNELGTVQPLSRIAKVLQEHHKQTGQRVNFHTDASQAPNWLPVDVNSLGVDMISLDGLKIYGPRGSGLLAVCGSVPWRPVLYGGGQENGRRPGTEDLSRAAGLTLALEKAAREYRQEWSRVSILREKLLEGLSQDRSDLRVNGDTKQAVPGILNLCFPGINAEMTVMRLDQEGVLVSAASACHSRQPGRSSPVVQEVSGVECASSSLRISPGRSTGEQDIEKALEIIKKVLG